MTMHGDRSGATALLRSAPQSLIEGFRLAKASRRGPLQFFRDAFDRKADPCLEGRMGRILEYLEKAGRAASSTLSSTPSWEDVSLGPIPDGAKPDFIVGEHLRVFKNECAWSWAQAKRMDYEAAKVACGEDAHAKDFERLYNADTFRAAMRARGVVAETGGVQWQADSGKGWIPYDTSVNAQIERARQKGTAKVKVRLGPKGWKYEVDLHRFVQRNPVNGTERTIRCIKGADVPAEKGKLTPCELEDAVQYYIDLCTLPGGASSPSSVMA